MRMLLSFEKVGLDLLLVEDLKERYVFVVVRVERVVDGSILRVLICFMDVIVYKRVVEEVVRWV